MPLKLENLIYSYVLFFEIPLMEKQKIGIKKIIYEADNIQSNHTLAIIIKCLSLVNKSLDLDPKFTSVDLMKISQVDEFLNFIIPNNPCTVHYFDNDKNISDWTTKEENKKTSTESVQQPAQQADANSDVPF